MKKIIEKPFNVNKLKAYISQIEFDNARQYAINSNGNEKIDKLNLIIFGKMAITTEIKRIIDFIENNQ